MAHKLALAPLTFVVERIKDLKLLQLLHLPLKLECELEEAEIVVTMTFTSVNTRFLPYNWRLIKHASNLCLLFIS